MTTDIPLLKRGELAARLKLSVRTVLRYEHLFAPAVIRIGRSVFYDFPATLEILRQRGSLLPPPSRRSAASTKNKPKRKVTK